MKNISEKIQEQNAIAISVLNYLLSDHLLKAVIHKFGSELAKRILQPLIKKVVKADELGSIDEKSKQTITHLMLHHSNKGRQYDGLRNELQILTNCIAAHMVFQGHHSFDEVHEASRRAIDALLITGTPEKDDVIKVIDHSFYKVGANFLHHSYIDKILADAQEHLPVAAAMPFKY